MKDARHKVLLVEDDDLDQMAFKRFVESEDLRYDCTVAGSIAEARSILDSECFDIVLADYSLGDGTGLDILDAVNGTPVILVTGAGDEHVTVKAWRAGAYDYLIKDLERNYLKAVPITIDNAIKYRKAKEQLQLLSAAIMSAADSICITNLEDQIIFVNSAFCKTYGYEENEIIGRQSNMLWIGEEESRHTRAVFQTSIAVGDLEVGFYHKRKDGSIFPVCLSRSGVADSGGNRIANVEVVRDISDLMRIEDKITELNAKMQEVYRKAR
jgi:PAS domain S-box-containing protein